MQEKYNTIPPQTSLPRIITSDIYLAACLMSLKCTLHKVVREDRKVAFVFIGEKVQDLKAAYKARSPLYVDAHSYRDNINFMRARMNETLTGRSIPYVPCNPRSSCQECKV